MAASYNFLVSTGTVVANTQDILDQVQAEYRAALGANINLAASTPQGGLVATETTARTYVMKNNVEVANNINPNYAYGVWLDAVCSLLGIDRGTNQSTIGTGVQITGDANTFVRAGSRVQTTAGDVFVTSADVTIPVGGITTVPVQSQQYGSIPLPEGDLTILDGTIGWGTATVLPSTTVVMGQIALKDPQLKNRRNKQLAKQGVGSSAALQAALLSVANVTSCQVIENNTGAAGVVNGVQFTLPSAMWACIGGTPDVNEVAMAMYQAHSSGCPWDFGAAGYGDPVGSPNGVAVVDPSTGKTYYVKYTTSKKYDCYVRIGVRQQTSVSDPQLSVQNAIMAYASGQEEGEDGLVVGADVSAFEMAGAVARALPGMYVKYCSVAVVPAGSPTPAYPADYVSEFLMPVYGEATLQINNITVDLV